MRKNGMDGLFEESQRVQTHEKSKDALEKTGHETRKKRRDQEDAGLDRKTSERLGSLISPVLERGIVISPNTGRSMVRPKSSW